MRSAPRLLALATLGAVVAGALAAADLARPSQGTDAAAAEFHAMTGGFGPGAGLDFAGCDAAFDARTGARCPHRDDPVVGGAALCPFLGADGR